MRSIFWMAGLVLLVLVAGSCDVTQPAQLSSQTFSLTFGATGGQVDVFYAYDTVEVDAGGNPIGDPFLSCFDSQTSTSPTSWPYYFLVEVSVLRAGETDFQLVTAGQALTDPTWNLTDYDTTTNVASPTPVPYPPPGQQETVIGGNGKTYMFLPQGRTAKPAVNGQVVEAVSCVPSMRDGCNEWATVYGNGLCSLSFPGPSRVSTDPTSMTDPAYPFPVTLEKGDTVAVTARRAIDAPNLVPSITDAVLNANFTLNGALVTVQGTTAETPPGVTGFRFTYTTR